MGFNIQLTGQQSNALSQNGYKYGMARLVDSRIRYLPSFWYTCVGQKKRFGLKKTAPMSHTCPLIWVVRPSYQQTSLYCQITIGRCSKLAFVVQNIY